MFQHYLKIAVRSLWFNKSSIWINLFGLSVAMAAAILIFMWIQSEQTHDRYHADADRIYLISSQDTASSELLLEPGLPYPLAEELQKQVPGVEMIARGMMQYSLVLGINEQKFIEEKAVLVDRNWTQMFHYKVIEGHLNAFESGGNKIALSQSKATHYFGNGSAIHQIIEIESIPHEVVAVFEDLPTNSSMQQDVLISNHYLLSLPNKANYLTGFNMYLTYQFIKVAPGTNLSQIEKRFGTLFKEKTGRDNSSIHFPFIPLTELHFIENLDTTHLQLGNVQHVRLFALLAFLLLVAASINFVNLSIARISNRTKEIGIRKIVGAEKRNLFTQIMMETALGILVALVIAYLWILIAIPHFNQLTDRNFTVQLGQWAIWIPMGLTFVTVLVLTGVYPALLLASMQPLYFLRKQIWKGMQQQTLRKSLVVVQVTVAMCMLVGVTVILAQYQFVLRSTEAYAKEQTFKTSIPFDMQGLHLDEKLEEHKSRIQQFKQELMAHSSIELVSQMNGLEVFNEQLNDFASMQWEGMESYAEEIEMVTLKVDENYQALAGLTLIEGRWFDPNNKNDRNHVILNETAVKAFGLQEPVIGKMYKDGLFTPDRTGQIIGVVKDFHHQSLRKKIEPVAMIMDLYIAPIFLIKAKPGQAQAAIQHLESLFSIRYPGKVFQYTFLDEEFDRVYREDQLALQLSALFGGLCLLITCIGLLGMIMATSETKLKEISIRKVLGATTPQLIRLLTQDILKLTILAILIALPIAWWATNRYLQDYTYRVDVHWGYFVSCGLLILVITFITISFQTIRTTLMKPVKSLREE
jgi:putative ABC transport system permease protein